MTDNNYSRLENMVMTTEMSDEARATLLNGIFRMKNKQVNIMIVGATGVGKSSTINALFDTNLAKVGMGADPETMRIEKYEFDNLVLWDTPGLGDGDEADKIHARNIVKKLTETDENGDALIDMILVIVDASTRDMGTTYALINNVIIPTIGREMSDRVLIALNQADMAMKGHNWDTENNRPNEILTKFLDDKVKSVKDRVYESTGVVVDPIYYCAGYQDEYGKQWPYNLTKLLYYIVKTTPEEKRLVLVDKINPNPNVWEPTDGNEDYKGRTVALIASSVLAGAKKYGDIGTEIGLAIGGVPGGAIGKAVGTAVGAILGFFLSW